MLFKLGEYIINTEKIVYADYNSNEGSKDSALKTSFRLYLACGERERVIVLYNNAADEAFSLLSDIAAVELKTGLARAAAATYEPERIQADTGLLNAWTHKVTMENEAHAEIKHKMEDFHLKFQEEKDKELDK